jgi:deoxyribose-phosphate aldolase
MDIKPFIEQTLLKPDTSLQNIRQLCQVAQENQFPVICIPPFFVRDADRLLGEYRKVKIATVVGFPMGYSSIAAKSEEVKRATDEGADHIDAVINIAAVKSGNWNHVEHDIDGLARATQMRGRTLKLILENGLLTDEEIRQVCEIAAASGVPWLKTGTGFFGNDATPEMVKTLLRYGAPGTKVKAAGGIRTLAQAQALIEAGASSIGTSAGLALIGK